MNYTAREEGPVLRDVADRAAAKRLPGDGVCFFDVRSTLPSAWHATFGHSTENERAKHNKTRTSENVDHHHKFPLRFARRSFPFFTGRRDVVSTSSHFTAEFMPHGGCKDDYKCFELTISLCHTPGFFHGVLRGIRLGPLGSDGCEPMLGFLEFPDLGRCVVRQVYFLCRHEAVNKEGSSSS
jgi:hypothetical protein